MSKRDKRHRPGGRKPDERNAEQGVISPRGRVLLAAGLIAAVGVLVYLNSFGGKFFFDDHSGILENPAVQRLWPVWETLPKMAREGMRPVAVLSLAINFRLGRGNPWGYHAFNLAVHVVAALLLFGIVRRTLSGPRLRERFGPAALLLALAVALIWIVHPLHTQAVTYIVQRAESLAGMFYLLTLYCAIRALTPTGAKWWWWGGAVAASALGMGAKQVMVTAPLMVVIWDWAFAPGRFRDTFRRRWPLYAALGATWLILLGLYRLAPRHPSAGFDCPYVTPFEYARTQFGVVLHYLRLIFWPEPLCLDYGWRVARTAWEVLPPAGAIAALIAATVLGLVRLRWLGFWGVWFFLILAPTSTVMPILDLAVEHRVYLSLAGVVAAVVLGGYTGGRALLDRVAPATRRRRRRRVLLGMGLLYAVVAALGWLTVRRNRYYHDEARMWADVVRQRDDHFRGHDCLGVALARDGRVDEAIEHHLRAIQLKPAHVDAYYNLGVALNKKGLTEEAIKRFAQALRLGPGHFKAWCNLGDALAAQGKLDEAEKCCRQALRLKPGYPDAHGGLAEVLAMQGKTDQAEKHYRQVLRIEPDRLGAHTGLARMLARKGDYRGATEHCRAAIRIDPESPEARRTFGDVLKDQGRDAAAVEQYHTALKGKSHLPWDLNNLAWLLATSPVEHVRNGPEAVRHAEQACQLTEYKDHVPIDTLAAAYAEAGRFDEAVAMALSAIALLSESDPPEGDRLKDYQHRLELYRAGRAFRRATDRPPP